jgi:FMN phosphatase YigB (HAD superfamily)
MPPSALLFDLENTFFDGTFWHRQLHQMVSRWGRPISFSDFKAAWQFNWLPQVYSGQKEYWQAMSAFLLDLGVEGCARIELLSTAKARLQSAQAGLRPYSGVAETLRDLQQLGYKLGILSNSIMSPTETLNLLTRIGIAVNWDYCLTSRAAGQPLPTPFAFHSAARGLAVRLPETIYISRNRERIAAAAESGMQTGLIAEREPGDQSPCLGANQGAEYTCLRELAQRIVARKAA